MRVTTATHTEKRRLASVALRRKASTVSVTCRKSKEKNTVNAQKVQQVVQNHLKTHGEHPFVRSPHHYVNKQRKCLSIRWYCGVRCPSPSCPKQARKNPHPLHHDAVDPHLSGASGVVKNIDPGESQRDHEEANVFSTTADVENSAEEEKRRLQEASKTGERWEKGAFRGSGTGKSTAVLTILCHWSRPCTRTSNLAGSSWKWQSASLGLWKY